MMYQKKKFPFGYIKDLKCRVLELPYEGKDLSMVAAVKRLWMRHPQWTLKSSDIVPGSTRL